jgi:hypothetical protein
LRYFLPAGLSRFAEEMRMADKTPDPADGARKRPAPTIDLTATEVPTEGQQAAAAEPHSGPTPEQSAAAHASEPGQWTRLAANIGGQTLVAGLAGAAIMTIVLLALWSAGLVPARHDGSFSADPGSINALNERIGKVESVTAKIPKEPGVSEQLAAADNAMKSLGITLTALNKRSDEAAANAADARTRALAAEKALAELRNNLQDLSKNTSAGLSPADVDTLQRRLSALEQAARSATVDNAARLALSAAALRDATASGAPFSVELDEVKSLGADEKTLAALAPFAASGLPTAAMLAQELHALIPAMMKASGAQAPAGGFLERLEANAGKLVRIRRLDAPAGDDPSAILARIEIEAANADVEGARADIAKLDNAARAPAQAWLAKVQARQAALAAARQFAAETAHALGKR